MSDHDHDHDHDEHDHGEGAHEIDKMPSSKLFTLLFGLSALTLAACIGVVQLFYQQVDSIRDTRNAKVSFQLQAYQDEMAELRDQWGAVWITDDDGVPESERGKGVHEAKRFHMPLSEARKRVLEQPAKYLEAARAYRGWRNPDANAPEPTAPTRQLQPAGRGAPGARPKPQQMGARVAPTGARPMPTPAGAKPGSAGADGKTPAKEEGKAPAQPAKPPKGEAPQKPAKPAKPAKPKGKAPAQPAPEAP